MSVEGARMRIFLLAASASLLLASPASAATRYFGIASFTKVRVDGPFKVTVTTGVAPFAKATGASGAALDRVAIDMLGDTLVVHTSQSSWGGYPGTTVGPVEVAVGTHDLSSAWVVGSGALSIDRVKGFSFSLSVQGSGGAEIGDVAADQMNISLIGSANARLAGQAKKLTALVRGISTLDAAKLASNDASIGAEGAATVDADVHGDASVNATGNATIRLTGRPTCTLKVGGSTNVSGCRP